MDATGRLLAAPVPLPAGKSPQSPYLQSGETPRVPASRGFEALAASRDGSFLYPVLEGALVDDADQRRRTVFEFDTAAGQYTEQTWAYQTDQSGNVVGDAFTTGRRKMLVVERDNFQGAASVTKRVYAIDLDRRDDDGFAPKTLVLDALKIAKVIDGVSAAGWFTEDFTLDELKTLRAKERLPAVRPANTAFDGLYEIPTFDEVLDLARRSTTCDGEPVGVYPETKHPTYFDSVGLSLEEPLLAELAENGMSKRRSPVIIQSFETGNLRELDRMTKVRLAQLVNCSGAPYDLVAVGDPRTYGDLVTRRGLAGVAFVRRRRGAVQGRDVPAQRRRHARRADGRDPGRSPGRARGARLDVPAGKPVPAGRVPQQRRSERGRRPRRRGRGFRSRGDGRPVHRQPGPGGRGGRLSGGTVGRLRGPSLPHCPAGGPVRGEPP